MTALSTIQSPDFAISAQTARIVRTLAGYLQVTGTGKRKIRPSAAGLRSILSVENRAGALSHHGLPKQTARFRLFRENSRIAGLPFWG